MTPLRHVAHARSGDKGPTVLIMLRPYEPGLFEILENLVTAQRVATHFHSRFRSVQRRSLRATQTMIFECQRAAKDTVTTSLWLDTHGKTLGTVLLDLEVNLEGAWQPTAPTVTISQGSLRGSRLDDDLLRFSSVPFAAPPTGARRFRPPVPPEAWAGLRDATQLPPAPMQDVSDVAPVVDEDCLYLNIWTQDPQGKRPVIVWLYGGGFESGSASPPATDGANLARRGVVVVTVNYRVGVLGFAHLGNLDDQNVAQADSVNLGIQDVVAALRLIKAEIAKFGGDPNNITLAGGSAGGFITGALLATPSAGGLIDKAIMISGATSRIFSSELATEMAKDLMQHVGAETVQDLAGVSGAGLVEAQRHVIATDIGARNTPGGRSWGVVLDGVVLPRDPQICVEEGAARDIPLLVGATRDEVQPFEIDDPNFAPHDEAALLAEIERCVGATQASDLLDAYKLDFPDADLARLRTRFLTDWIYRVPALRCAGAQARAGGSAWSYQFSFASPEIGAGHATDFDFFLDTLTGPLATDPEALRVRDEFVQAVLNFVTHGDPGWASYSPGETASTRDFGGATPLVVDPPRRIRQHFPA